MLTSLSSVTPRARLTQSRAIGPTISSILIRHRHQQQAHAFGFGWWASRSGDREQLRQRHMEAMQQKQAETINRWILWQQQAQSGDQSPLKRCGGRHWQPRRSFAFGRYGCRDNDNTDKTPREQSGQKNGEAEEKSAWGSFLFGESPNGKKSVNLWAMPFEDILSYVVRHQNKLFKEAGFNFEKPAAKDENDYVVDPITNRKVSKASRRSAPDERVQAGTSTFKSYRSRFEPSGKFPSKKATLDADMPPTAEELRAYGQMNVDDQPDLSAISDSADTSYMSWKYKGIFSGGMPGKYDDLDKYRPVFDKVSSSKADSVPLYDDLQKYKPVKHNEPDGKPLDVIEQQVYLDLDKYKPVMYNEPDGKPPGVQTSEAAVDPAELAKYKPVMYNEPHGKPAAANEEAVVDKAELEKYAKFEWNEPDGQPAGAQSKRAKRYKDTEVIKYQAVQANKPQDKAALKPEDFGYDPAEVKKYQAVRWNEPDGQPATPVKQGYHGYDQAEAQQYSPVRRIEPNGQPKVPVEKGHEGYDVEELKKYKAVRYNEPHGQSTAPTEQGHLGYNSDEVKKYGAFRWNEPDGKTAESGPKSTEAKKMTEAEWLQAMIDPYSSEPQGLETSYAEEMTGKSTWPLVSRVYSKSRTEDTLSGFGSGSGSGSSPAKGANVYKILAYDPATEQINSVETTSSVHDAAKPLTPAEVLLQLSHPAKFFSHFKPLEAEGFEIVSGSGDVLVFRKTRDGMASPSNAEEKPAKMPNPIDKTDECRVPETPVIPTTADFASPTGYVNLEKPTRLEEAPAFRSNIDVRREEPVFSGRKASSAKEEKKPASLPKRMLVGATWVAGVSYVLGLMAEQLK